MLSTSKRIIDGLLGEKGVNYVNMKKFGTRKTDIVIFLLVIFLIAIGIYVTAIK